MTVVTSTYRCHSVQFHLMIHNSSYDVVGEHVCCACSRMNAVSPYDMIYTVSLSSGGAYWSSRTGGQRVLLDLAVTYQHHLITRPANFRNTALYDPHFTLSIVCHSWLLWWRPVLWQSGYDNKMHWTNCKCSRFFSRVNCAFWTFYFTLRSIALFSLKRHLYFFPQVDLYFIIECFQETLAENNIKHLLRIRLQMCYFQVTRMFSV